MNSKTCRMCGKLFQSNDETVCFPCWSSCCKGESTTTGNVKKTSTYIVESTETKIKLITETICQEADRVVSGEKRDSYGSVEQSFEAIAKAWNLLLHIDFIDAHDVAMMMIMLKVLRENHSAKRDNLVDICGYAKCASLLTNEGNAST